MTEPALMAEKVRASQDSVATYVEILSDIATLQAHLHRLETHVLQLMHDFGITDKAIGEVQGLSSQRVGQKRRAQHNDGEPCR